MRVLLIDADKSTATHLVQEMSGHFMVDVAYSGEEGSLMSQVTDYAAIIVESNLADISSCELCRQAKNKNLETPIMVLLDQGDQLIQKISSIESGADIVLTKPVDSEEICAYLRSFIKKSCRGQPDNILRKDNLVVDIKTKNVIRGDKRIILRRKEFQILECLLLNIGSVVTKETLLEHIWEEGIAVESNTLEVHVKTLRDKIDKPFLTQTIITVCGYGYKIER